jgi:hypothetical protein
MIRKKVLSAVGLAALAATAASAQVVGPSTTTDPYLVPNPSLPAGSVQTKSLLTAGDSVGGYRLAGTPDGMGAWFDGSTIQLLVNHEFGATDGIGRAHGATGAFVSRWTIDPATLTFVEGRDHNTSPNDVYTYDRATGAWNRGADAWERFCSGDLAPQSAFQYKSFGTAKRIYLNGEETRPPFTADHGRAYAHIVTGPEKNETWELPALGRTAVENVVASPYPQLKTIVANLDDADRLTNPALTPAPSELYLYVGTKKKKAKSAIEAAGLTGGNLYGVRVLVNGGRVPAESNSFGFGTSSFVGSGRFEMFGFGDVTSKSGNEVQALSIANDVTRFQRVEDGAWDIRPGYENDFYFVTTASTSSNSRLFRVRFDDITNPELGGTIEIVLNGTEGHQMLDNVTIDPIGRIVMVEDVGGSSRLGKVWVYDLTNKNYFEAAAHDAKFFSATGANFLTTNEEASGVIEAFDLLGEGWYLINVQAHYTIGDPELVEGGQLLALYIDPALGR